MRGAGLRLRHDARSQRLRLRQVAFRDRARRRVAFNPFMTMKKSLLLWCSCVWLSNAVVGHALAGDYVVPRLAPVAAAPTFHPPPPYPPGVRWVTTPTDDGPGSLRQAIANAQPGDTIRFAPTLPPIILLRSTLVIDKDLVILGPGPQKLMLLRHIGAQTPGFRIFEVRAGQVTIAGLTIANGRAVNPDGQSDNLGGGIFNAGTLTVSNCVIAQNVALAEAGGNGFGGGIFTLGPLTLVDSTLRANRVNYAGGGLCTFHAAPVRVERCTISDNFAGVQGGGVNFQGRAGVLKNCTVSGNATSAEGTASGLLHLAFENEDSALDLAACTVTRNRGNDIGAVVLAALPLNRGHLTRLINTLVAQNESPNFFLDGNPTLQSLGHNLDSDGTSGLTHGVNGDQVGTVAAPIDARLGALLANGGPTRTHALLPGSPALDAGICQDADGAPLTEDQRRYPRPSGAACDMGAFENQPPQVRCPPGGIVNAWNDTLTGVVHDADGDALTAIWLVDGAPVQTNALPEIHPPAPRLVKVRVSLPPGPHTVGLVVSDGKAAPAECSANVVAKRPPR
jgi:hypothetical protein